MYKNSSTHKRVERFYPTPQNKIKLIAAVTHPDGTRKDGMSRSKLLNKALSEFFKSNPDFRG